MPVTLLSSVAGPEDICLLLLKCSRSSFTEFFTRTPWKGPLCCFPPPMCCSTVETWKQNPNLSHRFSHRLTYNKEKTPNEPGTLVERHLNPGVAERSQGAALRTTSPSHGRAAPPLPRGPPCRSRSKDGNTLALGTKRRPNASAFHRFGRFQDRKSVV